MVRLPALKTDINAIRVLLLHAGSQPEPIRVSFEVASLRLDPAPDVLECYTGESKRQQVEIELDEESVKIDASLHDALQSLRQNISRYVWVEQLCVDRDSAEEGVLLQREQRKRLHFGADNIFIWAGLDNEPEGALDGWLEAGDVQTTKYAFDFAHDAAANPDWHTAALETRQEFRFPKSCYLLRILYRPWFRRLPLVQKKYASHLANITVLCGGQSIPWTVINTTASLIRRRQPLPYILREEFLDTLSQTLTPERARRWMHARQEYGFETSKFVAHVYLAINQGTGKTREIMDILLSEVDDSFDLLRTIEYVTEMEATGLTSHISSALVNEKVEMPSLSFEGQFLNPPSAPDQIPFVHTPIMKKGYLRLVILMPHDGDPSAPLQCGICVTEKQSVPEFTFVMNSNAGNPFLKVDILVNGFSFQVPRSIALFLERIRDETEAKFLYIWTMSADTFEVRLPSSDSINPFWETIKEVRDLATDVVDVLEVLGKIEEGEIVQITSTLTENDWVEATKDDSKHVPMHAPFFREFEGPLTSDLDPRYMPMDRVADEIRLLALEPHHGDEATPLKGKLYHVPLRLFTQYQALSYTWGQSTKGHQIQLMGGPINITDNLYLALLSLRDETYIKLLWVDAICINQTDITERSRQVRRMRAIYQSAMTVLVWLGGESDNSVLAMDGMRQYYGEHTAAIDQRNMGTKRINIRPREFDDEEVEFWGAMYHFLLRPYFLRVWCIQEQVVALGILVLCGKDCVTWESLDCFATTVAYDWRFFSNKSEWQNPTKKSQEYDRIAQDARFLKLSIITKLRQAWFASKSNSLLSIMLACQNTECTDPRDKVYGLWGLANDAADLIPEPDYTKSVREVYTDFVVRWVEKYDRLDIICAAHVPRNAKKLPDMPTIVPDWSSPWLSNSFITMVPVPMGDVATDDLEHHPLYASAADTKPTIAWIRSQSSNGNETINSGLIEGLCAAGLCCDTIEMVGSICDNIPAFPQQDWFDMVEQYVKSIGGGEEELAQAKKRLLRVAVADRDPVGRVGEHRHTKDDSLDVLYRVITGAYERSEEGSGTGELLWEIHISNILRGRRFFITKKGHFGIGQSYVMEGLKICVLFGCSVPVVLRRWDNGMFRFFGDCFVEGMMEGEMISEADTKIPIGRGMTRQKFLELAANLPEFFSTEDDLQPRLFHIL